MLENDLYKARLNKLEEFRNNGIEPFPTNFNKTHNASEAVEELEEVDLK